MQRSTTKVFGESVTYFFVLIFASAIVTYFEIFYFQKDSYADWGGRTTETPYGSLLKTSALIYAGIIIIINFEKILNNKGLIAYTTIFTLWLSYEYTISFDYEAASMAAGKYLVPLTLLILGFIAKNKLMVIIYCVLAITVLNDLAQLFAVYPMQFLQIVACRLPYEGAFVCRASGLTDTAMYEMMNFSSAVISLYLIERHKFKLVTFFCFMGMLSLLIKSIVIFGLLFIYAIFFIRNQNTLGSEIRTSNFLMKIAITGSLSILTFLYLYQSGTIFEFMLTDRIQRYADLSSSTDRVLSYIAMIDSIKSLNIFGEGLGEFGGPASVIFNAPIHMKYIPNTSQLMTTDTYYPHLIIEWGILGSLVFLFMFFLPIISNKPPRTHRAVYYILIGFIFYSAIVTYAMEDLYRMSMIIPLLYPLAKFRHK